MLDRVHGSALERGHAVRIEAIVALLFIGCSPEVIVEPVHDAGDDAEIVDAATMPDGFVCDLN